MVRYLLEKYNLENIFNFFSILHDCACLKGTDKIYKNSQIFQNKKKNIFDEDFFEIFWTRFNNDSDDNLNGYNELSKCPAPAPFLLP